MGKGERESLEKERGEVDGLVITRNDIVKEDGKVAEISEKEQDD